MKTFVFYTTKNLGFFCRLEFFRNTNTTRNSALCRGTELETLSSEMQSVWAYRRLRLTFFSAFLLFCHLFFWLQVFFLKPEMRLRRNRTQETMMILTLISLEKLHPNVLSEGFFKCFEIPFLHNYNKESPDTLFKKTSCLENSDQTEENITNANEILVGANSLQMEVWKHLRTRFPETSESNCLNNKTSEDVISGK